MALTLVAQDHGSQVALAVAKHLAVFTQRRGGQSQFNPFLSDPLPENSLVASKVAATEAFGQKGLPQMVNLALGR